MSTVEAKGVGGGPASADPGEQTVQKLSFDAGTLSGYAAQMRERGRRAVRVRETGQAPNRAVVFVAGRQDAADVLTDEDAFSVCHYARLFGAVSPQGAYLLMRDESPERTLRYEILERAKLQTPWWDADPQVIRPALRELARGVVESLMDAFRRRETPAFDVLGEFGAFAPYLVACEVFGLPGPQGCDPFAWLATQAMTLPKFRPFTAQTGPYLTQALWSQMVLGQLFADFENREAAIRLLAGASARRFLRHIRATLARPAPGVDPARRDLLSALRLVRPQFPQVSDAAYETHVLYLLLELVGTALAVPAAAFTSLIDAEVARTGGPLRFDGLMRDNADAYVDEALRLAGATGHLLRTATRTMAFADVQIEKDDYVCALVADAERDVPDGDRLTPGRPQSAYLHFGPEGGPHRCFGRPIALPMLGEMMLGLQSLPGLQTTADLTKAPFIGIETRRVVRFDPSTAKLPGQPQTGAAASASKRNGSATA
jgi:cytochrome P450